MLFFLKIWCHFNCLSTYVYLEIWTLTVFLKEWKKFIQNPRSHLDSKSHGKIASDGCVNGIKQIER